ncbi:MAG: hypothetical protein COT34_00555 [Candidatus Nealsonbacteria bacterium CG08_land_8_20_14_0_20_43_11]|uniref:Uncharacterized protein n=1 Tax=Candidatus Nealsonbacteria bacterium CG08_land_8_20_14_0_20_43_11 TaxID=1974706 RepID=A0A2M6T162_9BACT|nr:MAG: hypothetical protein COT34_00555 [Candidatus Nealsonbacteria bacterium CG08_land_8_20_14_0_20_43_11]
MKQTRIRVPGTKGASSLNARFGPVFKVWFGLADTTEVDADVVLACDNAHNLKPRTLTRSQKARIRRAFPGVKITDFEVQ